MSNMVKLDPCSQSVALLTMCLALTTDGEEEWGLLHIFRVYQKRNSWWKKCIFEFFLHCKEATCTRKATKELTKFMWKKTGLSIFLIHLSRPVQICVAPWEGASHVSVRKVNPPLLSFIEYIPRFLGILALTPQLNFKMQVSQKQQFAHSHFFSAQNRPAFDITTW